MDASDSEGSERNTKPWYFDTPNYARPTERRRELASLYPLPIGTIIDRLDPPQTILENKIYRHLSYISNIVRSETTSMSAWVRSAVDKWIKMEMVVRASLRDNPDISNARLSTSPIPKYLIIGMTGLVSTLVSRRAASKWTRALLPSLSIIGAFAVCYPNTCRDLYSYTTKSLSDTDQPPSPLKYYHLTKDKLNEWQATHLVALRDKFRSFFGKKE